MRIILIHQHDPTAFHVGGIGTFINNFLKYSPAGWTTEFVGVTRDQEKYPVGKWGTFSLSGRTFRFLPVVFEPQRERRPIPLSLRFSWALNRYRPMIDFRKALLEFHRLEPALPLRDLKNPMVLYLHGHMGDLYHPNTEVGWGRFPGLYFFLERRLIHKMAHVYIVREDAVAFYQKRYPAIADRFSFLPTWVDQEVFDVADERSRLAWRRELAGRYKFDPARKILLFVGRFEGQKDPMFLLDAVRLLQEKKDQILLVMIGAGTLKASMDSYLDRHGLSASVRILAPMMPSALVPWMNVADAFVLSSAFEGMPRVVVEALRCGLPVVATKVGEVGRLIRTPAAGRLVEGRDPVIFSAAVEEVLKQPRDREVCRGQVSDFAAVQCLQRLYDDYKKWAAGAL